MKQWYIIHFSDDETLIRFLNKNSDKIDDFKFGKTMSHYSSILYKSDRELFW